MNAKYESLMLKLLDGSIEPEERRVIDNWINESPLNKQMSDEFQLIWNLSADEAKIEFDTKGELSKFENSIKEHLRFIPEKEDQSQTNRNWLRIAASIGFIAACSWLIYSIGFADKTILKESHDSLVQLALPDGSQVWLNRQTKLLYEEKFNDDDRVVQLEGEAYFEVVKNADNPFTIKTNHAVVTVLGTSFNLQAYPDGNNTELLVTTGAVQFGSLGKNASSIILKRGDAAVLDRNELLPVLTTDQNPNILAWKEKRLIYKRTSVGDVVKSLEDYFHIRIDVKNSSILRCRFTGSFVSPEIEDIVEALRVSLDLNISQQGRGYVIEGQGC